MFLKKFLPKTGIDRLSLFLLVTNLVVMTHLAYRMYDWGSPLNRGEALDKESLVEILDLVGRHYVDSLDMEKLLRYVVDSTLGDLDPHSYYVGGSDLEISNSRLEGNFEGVGIEFNIFDDTIHVITPLQGGPSRKAGILGGDKIIRVDKKVVAGIGVTLHDVVSLLRGERGSQVEVDILRSGMPALLNFHIVRETIAQESVDVSYLVDDTTGYIKISGFSATTLQEFQDHLGRLKRQGADGLILDLRDNPGGYMRAATEIVDQFLEKGKLITYTVGKDPRSRRDYFCERKGLLEEGELIVLINEGSASASEIVAGAVKDHCRGVLVGRRSFGKGLVQNSFPLPSGGQLRLTTRRYFTPSGLCIQAPYQNRFHLHADIGADESSETESTNPSGLNPADTRKGGIQPDIWVERGGAPRNGKTVEWHPSYMSLHEFAVSFYRGARHRLDALTLDEFLGKDWFVASDLEDLFALDLRMSRRPEDNYRELKTPRSHPGRDFSAVKGRMKAHLARIHWGELGFYRVINKQDPVVRVAVKRMGS